jgi:hypothetical protein
MNTTQRAEVIQILSKDCKGRYLYLNCDGETCAIGALGLAAGVSRETLEVANVESIDPAAPSYQKTTPEVTQCVNEIAEKINKKFALERHQLGLIQSINDGHKDHVERVRMVLKVVDSFPVED